MALSLVSNANALDLQGYKFTDSYRYSSLEDTGFEHFGGPSVIHTSIAHIKTPLFVTDPQFGRIYEEVISRYDLVSLGTSYRFSDTLTLGIESSFLNTQLSDHSESHSGDTHLKAKILLLKDNSQAFSFLPELTLPTGSQSSFTTKKELSGSFKIAYEKHAGDIHFLGSVGFAHSPENSYSVINYRNLILSELGLSYDMNKNWNINLEVNRNFTTESDYRQDEGDYYLTLKHMASQNTSIYGGAGVSGFSEIARKNWSIFVGLKFDFGEIQNTPVAKIEKPVEKVIEKTVVVKEVSPPTAPVKERTMIIIKSMAEEKKLFGTVFAKENILFANAKANIENAERLKIDSLVAKFSKHKHLIKHIVIEGYASKVGPSTLNQTLSLKRAQGVQKALIESGIDESLTSIVAYGDRELNPNKIIEKNRKVQFRIYVHR
jgi:outer membrane protein OmpA-like peptidoglycan-associated protein